MQDLVWLVTRREEVPEGDAWLSAFEAERASRMSVPQRRADFRHGRWTAKRALDQAFGRQHEQAPPRWCVRPADDGAPEAFEAEGAPAPFALSISHRAGLAAALVTSKGIRPGIDLELVEERSDQLISQFFTDKEQRRVRTAPLEQRALTACLVWSAKESALKALRTGLREDTRAVEVEWQELPVADSWRDVVVTHGSRLSGRARLIENAGQSWVVTLVTIS